MSFVATAGDLTRIMDEHFPKHKWSAIDTKITYWDSSNEKVQPTQSWIDTKLAEYGETGRALAILRIRRHTELDHSDWTRLDDNGLSAAKKAEWATYRQELRDLPSTADPKLNEKGYLTNVTWPTEPE